MRGYMQIESVRETSKVGNSKGAKRLTVAELEKAKSHSSLTTRTAPTSPSGGRSHAYPRDCRRAHRCRRRPHRLVRCLTMRRGVAYGRTLRKTWAGCTGF